MCLGIPGRIVSIDEDAGMPVGVVDFGGVRRQVCLAYVADEVEVGDYAVIHVGFAISRVDEEEARRTYAALEAMGELDELEWLKEVARRAASVSVAEEGGAAGAPPTGAGGNA
jgi:hydrogenase expression/formation protein HypC